MMGIFERQAREQKRRTTLERRQEKAVTAARRLAVDLAQQASGENYHSKGALDGWMKRRKPYPKEWKLKFCSRDFTKNDSIERATKRSLHYAGWNPNRVIHVGSMIAVGRKPTPRGKATEWFEYVADDPIGFRLFVSKLRRGIKVGTGKVFEFSLYRPGYTTQDK